MAGNRSINQRKFILFLLATAFVGLSLYVFYHLLEPSLHEYLRARMSGRVGTEDNILKIPKLILWSVLAFLAVRALNTILFDFVFRIRRGFEAPTLVRNVFSLVAFTILFVLIFNRIYVEVNLGALFTTSAIFGVIIGLALQDTLGNLFAGISVHADKPFQVGDVITVGTAHTGVVESISSRAGKLRTFQNHVLMLSNSAVAKEAIQVCPRDNLNARIVQFNTLYSDSPAKTIHVVREAIREADNVSQRVTPIVRVRNFGDSSVDWE